MNPRLSFLTSIREQVMSQLLYFDVVLTPSRSQLKISRCRISTFTPPAIPRPPQTSSAILLLLRMELTRFSDSSAKMGNSRQQRSREMIDRLEMVLADQAIIFLCLEVWRLAHGFCLAVSCSTLRSMRYRFLEQSTVYFYFNFVALSFVCKMCRPRCLAAK